MTCRRCSECEGQDHHWLDNQDFGNDPDEAEDPTGNQYVCKHCEAVGNECNECEGEGEIMDDEACHGSECPVCDGRGIVRSKPRSFEEVE
jgi:hypothetical protein